MSGSQNDLNRIVREKLMSEKQWVGIDVCQKYLDVYIRPKEELFQVTNNEVGISSLVQTLSNIQPELIVLEATGGMEIDVAIELTQAGLYVAVINPRQAKDTGAEVVSAP